MTDDLNREMGKVLGKMEQMAQTLQSFSVKFDQHMQDERTILEKLADRPSRSEMIDMVDQMENRLTGLLVKNVSDLNTLVRSTVENFDNRATEIQNVTNKLNLLESKVENIKQDINGIGNNFNEYKNTMKVAVKEQHDELTGLVKERQNETLLLEKRLSTSEMRTAKLEFWTNALKWAFAFIVLPMLGWIINHFFIIQLNTKA